MELKQANQTHIKSTLQVIANYTNGRVFEGYSGRNMFSAMCFGITCSDYINCIETASEFGIKGARWDTLGKDFIVYWPHLKYEKE